MKCINYLFVISLGIIDIGARDPFNVPEKNVSIHKEQKKSSPCEPNLQKSTVAPPSHEWELISTNTQSFIFKNQQTGDMRIIDAHEEQSSIK